MVPKAPKVKGDPCGGITLRCMYSTCTYPMHSTSLHPSTRKVPDTPFAEIERLGWLSRWGQWRANQEPVEMGKSSRVLE